MNGMAVSGLSKSGAIAKDGRIKLDPPPSSSSPPEGWSVTRAGDYLTRLNNENLRCVTRAQSKSILKRANLVGKSLE